MSVNEHEMQIINKAFDDLISREAACEIINDIRDCISVEGYCAILERLKKLPPVTQKSETVTEFADRCRECGAHYGRLLKQKSGHWILQPSNKEQGERDFIWWKCSECGQVIFSETEKDRREYHAFCGRCGAKMVEQKETETWHGIHAQITAPKGTFERIFNEADDDYDI